MTTDTPFFDALKRTWARDAFTTDPATIIRRSEVLLACRNSPRATAIVEAMIEQVALGTIAAAP
jgi:hypothetical protein